jgi:hypothetical protein
MRLEAMVVGFRDACQDLLPSSLVNGSLESLDFDFFSHLFLGLLF